VWENITKVLSRIGPDLRHDPVKAVSVSSLGEAVVPVSRDRKILGPSILNFDTRGGEYLGRLPAFQDAEKLYGINGNTLGNNYGLTKLLWIKDHRRELYDRTYKFLNWGAFVLYMLGADPVIDYSLANRSLLFDISTCSWSDFLLAEAGFDRDKLPEPVVSGTGCGSTSKAAASKTGLPEGALLTAGAHDQCANALGCGVLEEGQAMYGMGTFICIVPVFRGKKDPKEMIRQGLNTEHHAAGGLFASFIYNPGGAVVKWYRDTFAALEHETARKDQRDVYDALFDEIPEGHSRVMSLPHFSVMGPPRFIDNSSGVITGLYLDTKRGEILKGLIEGATFSLKESVDMLPEAGISVDRFICAGGGSKSDRWVQLSADIMGAPFQKPDVTEAGSLGAAILAGTGAGMFSSPRDGVKAMVKAEKQFEPDMKVHGQYQGKYEKFKKLWPLLSDYLTSSFT
jgi:xylulokinase